MTKRVPEMLVERYVAGDLSPQRMSEVELRLREEQGGLERLAVLRASNETERVAHPPEQLMPEITRRARALALAPKPALRARLLWLPAPLLAVPFWCSS